MLQTGVANTGAATVGGFIYVPGGFDGVSELRLMQKYDPVTDTVTTGAPMPVGNFAHGVAAQGTKVYVLGGSATGVAGTTNLIYDTVADTWSTGAAVPTAVGYPTAVSDGTYVYLLGGNTTYLNIVQRYNPATKRVGYPRDHASGARWAGVVLRRHECLGRRRRLDRLLRQHRVVQPGGECLDRGSPAGAWHTHRGCRVRQLARAEGRGLERGLQRGGREDADRRTAATSPTSTTTTASASSPPPPPPGPPCGPKRILIVYSDTGPPTQLVTALQGEADVTSVDLFDAQVATPTLNDLNPYNLVITLGRTSRTPTRTRPATCWPTTRTRARGLVVPLVFSFHDGQFGLFGRWRAEGYSPFAYSQHVRAGTYTLGAHDPSHPLMQGVTALNTNFRMLLDLAPGATRVAAWSDSVPLLAFKDNVVALNAYIGARGTVERPVLACDRQRLQLALRSSAASATTTSASASATTTSATTTSATTTSASATTTSATTTSAASGSLSRACRG